MFGTVQNGSCISAEEDSNRRIPGGTDFANPPAQLTYQLKQLERGQALCSGHIRLRNIIQRWLRQLFFPEIR